MLEHQQQLRELGVPVDDQNQAGSNNQASYDSTPRSHPQPWTGSSTSAQYPPLESPTTYHAPAVDPACRSAEAGLSILNGTTLSLFGMQIDVAKFSNAHDDPHAPTAYETFVRYAFGQATVPEPPLPPTLEEAKKFAWWYFRSLNPYYPILDKADFFELVCGRGPL